MIKLRDEQLSEDIQICEGENVSIRFDKETKSLYISAPAVNKTSLKHGPFLLNGDVVEIEAGRNISISSVHPNKLIIGADFDKDRAKILALEERVNLLERTLSILIEKATKK